MIHVDVRWPFSNYENIFFSRNDVIFEDARVDRVFGMVIPLLQVNFEQEPVEG
jgi:hypothetical protein